MNNQRNEVITQIMNHAEQLNVMGLEELLFIAEGFSGLEEYQKDTTVERYEEIRAQDKAEMEARSEQWEKERKAAFFERMRRENFERKQKIANLQGSEKRFWDNIRSVRKMDGAIRLI